MSVNGAHTYIYIHISIIYHMSEQEDSALSLMDKHGVSKPWISTPPNNRRYLILQGV
jgi:hypothetical protein